MKFLSLVKAAIFFIRTGLATSSVLAYSTKVINRGPEPEPTMTYSHDSLFSLRPVVANKKIPAVLLQTLRHFDICTVR